MIDVDLDTCYTALAEAIGRCDQAKAPLLLSTLCLALIAEQQDAESVLRLIAQAERLSRV